MKVSLLDINSGNLRSVARALHAAGGEVVVVNTPEALRSAERIVVPGQGAFGVFRDNVNQRGWDEPLRDYLQSGRPYLGICLGMQVLADRSEEQGGHAGLGVLPGAVEKLAASTTRKIPHVGWNKVRWQMPHPLTKQINNDSYFYFVHSYAMAPLTQNNKLATTDYEGHFVSAVAKDNVVGVQFHPEKSGTVGITLLKNYLEWRPS